LNEIKLSGALQGVVEHHGNGQPFVTGTLEFDREGHTILLLAAGARVRQLQLFDSGDFIRAIGRLTFFKDQFAVLIDECSPWAIANHTNKKFSYDESQTQRTVRELET
jgi:hypothetical protein